MANSEVFLINQVGTFHTTGSLNESRQFDNTSSTQGALLNDGRVLVVGGIPGSGNAGAGLARINAELFDPVTETWNYTTGPLNVRRVACQTTLLNDGKVLITGGHESSYSGATIYNSAEIFDPSSNNFTLLGSNMVEARTRHVAVKLNDGRVLIVGGHDNSHTYASAEMYDPNTNTFSSTGSMSVARYGGQTATLLDDGRVLIVGSHGGIDAELYDPSTGTFTVTGSLNFPRNGHTATMLNNGKVLIVGGGGSGQFHNTAEIYDPTTETFSLVSATMMTPREYHTATLLPDGRVLIVAGRSGIPHDDLSSAEIFDPVTETFQIAGSISTGKYQHIAAQLQDGRVVIVGGAYDPQGQSGSIALANSDVYNPTTTKIERGNVDNVLEEFSLFQNYPNPFNPVTTIRFFLPISANVKIDVFNSIGQQVATLLDQRKSIGYHSEEFNGFNLSSGVYFYRIQVRNFQQIKKMMLLK